MWFVLAIVVLAVPFVLPNYQIFQLTLVMVYAIALLGLNMLTGYSQPPEWERLAVAPLTMRKRFVEWIRREAAHARAAHGRKDAVGGRIIAKFNSMVDQSICDELYAAS